MSYNITPYNDSAAVFDETSQRYVLRKNYLETKTGIKLTALVRQPFIADPTTAINDLLDQISQEIYDFIYSYNGNMRYQKYIAAHSELARQYIIEAMVSQFRYILRNGKIDEYSGINLDYVSTNAKLELTDLRGERAFHPNVVSCLSRLLEDGDRLLFCGQYLIPYGFAYPENY